MPLREQIVRSVVALALVAAGPVVAGPPEPAFRLGSEHFRQSAPVTGITYSTDGKRLATIDGNAIQVWDASDGRCLHTVRLRDHELAAVAFAEGQLLAAAYFQREMCICRVDPADNKPPSRRFFATGKAECAFSPDGKYLAFRKPDRTMAEVIDTDTGKAVVSDLRLRDKFHSFGFRGDSQAVAVSTEAGVVRIHDLPTGHTVNEFRVEDGAAAGMTFSPDGESLVAEMSATESIHLACFDLPTGQIRWRHRAHLAKYPAYSSDGTTVRFYGVASSSNEPLAWRWLDAKSGKLLDRQLFADQSCVATRPDGKVLAAGDLTGLISQWDLESRRRLDKSSASPPDLVTNVRFTPDGSKVRGWARAWYEWDLKTGKQIRLTPPLKDESPGMVVSDDQRWLARLAPKTRTQYQLELIDLRSGERTRPLAADRSPYAIRFTSTGRLIVFEADGLTAIDPASGKQVATLRKEASENELAVSNDGVTAIAVTRLETALKVAHWDLSAGRRIGSWEYRFTEPGLKTQTFVKRATLSADGRLLAIPLSDVEATSRNVHETGIFQTRTGRLVSSWFDNAYWSEVEFSPDGRSMAVFAGLGVQVREVVTGSVRRDFPANRPVSGCAFSPDGRLLAIATRPQPIEVYDLFGDQWVGKWDAGKAESVWSRLATRNAADAFKTMDHLHANPAEAVAFLRERMKLPQVPTREWLAARIRHLDAAGYRDREKATADLAAAGELAAEALREARTTSPEAQQRIASLLPKVEAMTPDMLRAIRACEVLEGIGTTDAKALLAEWVKAGPGSTLGREAAESLARLNSPGK